MELVRVSCDQRAPFLPSYSRMLDCQCVKACQAQELYQGWLGSSWPWEHSNAAFSPWGTAEEQITCGPLIRLLWL